MKKNLNIQALRGVCAIMVFLSHSMHVYNCEIVHTLDRTPLRLLYAGEVAVSIFFVLSGFFYYNKSSDFSLRQYINTIIKKTKRIYPPHIIFLTIGFILLTVYQKFGWHDDFNTTDWFQGFWKSQVSFIEFLKGCSVVLLPDTNLINPPVWYLEAEVKMFITMPFLVYVFNKKGWWLSIPILIFCTFWKIPAISCVGYYVLGALARKYNEQCYCLICRSKTSFFICLFVALGLLNIENEVFVNNRFTNMISCLGACIVIIILYNKKIKILEKHTLQFFGTISYDFYLCHFIVLLSLKPFISGVSLIIVSFIVSLLIAYTSYKILANINIHYGLKKDN